MDEVPIEIIKIDVPDHPEKKWYHRWIPVGFWWRFKILMYKGQYDNKFVLLRWWNRWLPEIIWCDLLKLPEPQQYTWECESELILSNSENDINLILVKSFEEEIKKDMK